MSSASLQLDFAQLADDLNAYLSECALEGLVFRDAEEASWCYCTDYVFPRMGKTWSLLPDEHLDRYKRAYSIAFEVLLDKDCWRLAQALMHDKTQRELILSSVCEQLLAA